MHPCELLKHDEKLHYDDMPIFSFCLTPRVLHAVAKTPSDVAISNIILIYKNKTTRFVTSKCLNVF
jgi:hypothetical protein